MKEEDINIFRDMLAGIYIQQLRIYDLLSAIALSAKQEEVENILLSPLFWVFCLLSQIHICCG